MKLTRIIGILLIIAGILGLIYGGFNYQKPSHEANIGPLHMAVSSEGHVNIPFWAGVGAIVLGGVLLVLPGLKK
jgi:drug/metabolite transporter (DMT)-like permease